MGEIVKGLASMGVVYTLHYAGAKAYSAFCVPDGVWGFVQGLVTTGGPVCTVILKTVEATASSYSSILAMGATRLAIDFFVPK